MAGAPKQFDREEVIVKAMEVFWAQGYESTSMQDLVNGMGINRASMYETFGNKHEIYLLAIHKYAQKGIEHFEELLSTNASPLENIKHLCYFFTDEFSTKKRFGCFANNTAIELGPHDEVIAKIISDFWNAFEALIEQTLQQAKAQGKLDPQTNTSSVAALINATLQGLSSMSKVGFKPEQLRTIADQLLASLFSDNC